VIALCVAAGLDYRQAAEALNIPVGTVRSRLSRARNRLARHLGRPGPARGVAQTEVRTVQGSGPTTRTGWMRETGKDAVMPGQRIPIVTRTPVHAGLDHPTCTWPATLPTDPEALRTLLYAQTEPWGTLSQDETVFRNVGDLLRSTIMPPATASALYKVLERIPGVTVIPDTVDAAGRHGIGITRKDPASATRDEWIFKKNTLACSRLTVIHDRRQAHGRHRRHVVRHRRHHGARGRRQVRRGPRERQGLTLARTPPGRPTPGCPRRRRPHPVRPGQARSPERSCGGARAGSGCPCH